MIRTIANRYAKALIELAEEKKIVDRTTADLAAFADAVEATPTLRKLFTSPIFTPDNKKAVIADLAAKLNMHAVTKRFVEHLAETGRIRYIREVREAYQELLATRLNRAAVRLTTAAAIAPADLAGIKQKLESLTGKQVDIDTRIDPALIGGAKAQVGSVVFDGSIRNQLSKMRDRLTR